MKAFNHYNERVKTRELYNMLLRKPKIFLIGFLIVVLALLVLKYAHFSFVSGILKSIPQPAAYVHTSNLPKKTWLTVLSEPGQIKAIDEIAVMSKTNGFVHLVGVQTGQKVAKDDVLLVLENKEQYYSLEKGKAAQKLAESSFSRAKELFKQNMISKEQFEESLSALNQSEAEVSYLETLVDDMTVKAPFSGHVDYIDLSPGQYVQAGRTLFHLTSLPPYQVEFTLPQEYFQYVKKDLACSALIGGVLHDARIDKIGHIADNSTKRFKVSARLLKHQKNFIAGGSARIQIAFEKSKDPSFVLALEAIDFTPLGPTLWTYEENENGKLVAKSLAVKITSQHDDECVIEADSLVESMPIIISGFQKLRQGGFIKIVEPEL